MVTTKYDQTQQMNTTTHIMSKKKKNDDGTNTTTITTTTTTSSSSFCTATTASSNSNSGGGGGGGSGNGGNGNMAVSVGTTVRWSIFISCMVTLIRLPLLGRQDNLWMMMEVDSAVSPLLYSVGGGNGGSGGGGRGIGSSSSGKGGGSVGSVVGTTTTGSAAVPGGVGHWGSIELNDSIVQPTAVARPAAEQCPHLSNDEIEELNKPEARSWCRQLGLAVRGNVPELKARLKEHFKNGTV